jgi:hypothetical protein
MVNLIAAPIDQIETRAEFPHQVRVDPDIRVTADAERFFIKGEYRAIENGRLVRRRKINTPVKREFV